MEPQTAVGRPVARHGHPARAPARRAPAAALLAGLALLLAGGGAPAAAGGGPDRPFLQRLDDEKDPGHAAAATEWEGLSDEAKWTRLHEALASEDGSVARIAAETISPLSLSLADLRRQAAILAARPRTALGGAEPPHAWAVPIPIAIGGADLVAFWGAVAKDDAAVTDGMGVQTHRFVRARDVPDLVPFLATLGPRGFRSLLGDLFNIADHVEGHAALGVLARGFLYALARLKAEAAGKPPPEGGPLAGPDPDLGAADRAGYPAALKTLLLASLRTRPEGLGFLPKDPDAPTTFTPAQDWLRRWGAALFPGPDDVPALAEVAVKAPAWPLGCWAARALAKIPGAEAGKGLETAAARPDAAGLVAAAELARLGRPDRLAALRATEDPKAKEAIGKALEVVPWIVDPAAAPAEAAKAIRAGEHPDVLAAFERAVAWRAYSVEVPEAALRAIAMDLLAKPPAPEDAAWFFGKAFPEFVVAGTAPAVAKALGAGPESPDHLGEWVPVLSRLEAVAPDTLLAVARAWRGGGEGKAGAAVLARLGDAEAGRDPAAAWALFAPGDRWALGAIPGDGVEAFLRERAASDDPNEAADALQGLARRHGVPPLAARLLAGHHFGDDERGQKDLDAARKTVLAGDPVAAILAVAEFDTAGPLERASLGLVGDPRARERLAAWRAKPWLGRTWPATAGLAATGDAEAAKEWTGFLADGRTYLLDDLNEAAAVRLPASRDDLDFLVARLADNCCLSWESGVALARAFPTIPDPEGAPGLGPELARTARAWVERTHGKFTWSRIADGWVPAE